MRIGIGLKSGAYTPEAYAYCDALQHHGHVVDLSPEAELAVTNDVNIYFLGFRPYSLGRKYKGVEVHDYASASTPPWPRIKDFLKRKLNKKPKLRIFLNEFVKEQFDFKDGLTYIYRDMGVDPLFLRRCNYSREYDIVYCGSLSGRTGLEYCLNKLARNGFKLLIIGEISPYLEQKLRGAGDVTCTGRLKRGEIPAFFYKCECGLNIQPDTYPFGSQTSTKVLEYMAAGLKLISSKCYWVDQFCKINDLEYLELGDVSRENIRDLRPCPLDLAMQWEWSRVLDRCAFVESIENSAEQ